MSATTSAATGRCFGIQRVCQVWERSRSALYARRARAHHRLGAGPARRGAPPRQSDAQLLAAIRTDLARSPFHGEGHRKVHARLRILDGIRVARTRVLRVMRAHGLLSPHRGRQGAAKTHDGRVITQAPNVMWGTDGVRVFTLDDGWGWIFAAVEHWNAECVGWHVCKVGSRFAALDPIAQGLERRYGSLDADVARGLALRMDHGSQYLSDHFLKQIRYWGIHPSFGFVEEPETNGVAERWNRTLKEQRSTAESFKTSRPSAPPWPTSWSGTTRPGVSRSLGITRRSRRARSMSYARRHSTNVCPGNRVRYMAPSRSPPVGRMACSGSAACGTAPAPVCMRGGRRHGLLHCVVAAGRSARPRTTSWWPTFAGCSKPRRFMARATEKPGRSCGSRGCAPRRSGCAG